MQLFRFFAVFILTVFFYNANAQISNSLYTALPDSLQPKNKISLTAVEKVKVLKNIQPNLSVKYKKELLQIACILARRDAQEVAWSEKIRYLTAAADWCWDNETDSSIAYYMLLIAYAKQNKDFRLAAKTYVEIGELYSYRERFNESINALITADSTNIDRKDSTFYTYLYSTYSVLYGQLRLNEKAIFFSDLVLKWEKESEKWNKDYIKNIISSVVQYASIFNTTHQRKYADIANSRLSLIMEHVKGQSGNWYEACYLLKGYLSYSVGNYADAIAFLDSSMLPQYNQSSLYYANNNYVSMLYKGVCLVKMGKYLEGRELLLPISMTLSDKQHQLTRYSALCEAAVAEGNYKDAFAYKTKVGQLSDSLDIEGSRGKVFEAEQKYSLAQKEAAIAVLEKKNTEVMATRNKLILWGIILLLTMALTATLLYTRNKQQQALRRAERAELTERLNQMEEEMEQERLRQQAQQSAAITDQRKTISADMHDGIGSDLATLRFFISDIKRKITDKESKAAIADIEEEVSNIYLRSRDFMHELNKGNPQEKYNVADLLENLELRFNNNSSLQVHVEADREGITSAFTVQQHNEMYRIIREAVANSLKHSGASHIHIKLLTSNKDVYFEIKDNGKGINSRKENGIGMEAMTERMKALNGNFKIDGASGGTRIWGSFPIVKAA